MLFHTDHAVELRSELACRRHGVEMAMVARVLESRRSGSHGAETGPAYSLLPQPFQAVVDFLLHIPGYRPEVRGLGSDGHGDPVERSLIKFSTLVKLSNGSLNFNNRTHAVIPYKPAPTKSPRCLQHRGPYLKSHEHWHEHETELTKVPHHRKRATAPWQYLQGCLHGFAALKKALDVAAFLTG